MFQIEITTKLVTIMIKSFSPHSEIVKKVLAKALPNKQDAYPVATIHPLLFSLPETPLKHPRFSFLYHHGVATLVSHQ